MSANSEIFNKRIISWSLYDFANTIYSMNILTFYLKRYIIEDLGRDGLYYDLAYAGSMLAAGILMPALGALSDYSAKKKTFLFLFTVTCCLATGLMTAVPAMLAVLLVIIFAVSNFFYEGGMVFYNALLYSVSSGEKARLVSGLGVALGYTGSIIGLILVPPFVTGDLFGYDISFLKGGGKMAAFIPTAIIFLLFSIPLFIWVKEKKELVKQGKIDIRQAYRNVWEGVKNTRRYPGVLRFLIADYFFEDTAATIIINISIFCSIVLTLAESQMQIFLIICTIAAMFGAYIIGYVSQYFPLKRMMYFVVYGWIVSLSIILFTDNIVIVYIIGCSIGVFLGGLWTVSRPLLAELVPKEDLGRFFGLFSLSGKAAAVIGPIVWGVTVYVFKPGHLLGDWVASLFDLDYDDTIKLSYKLAVFALIIMMVIGLVIFRKLPEKPNH